MSTTFCADFRGIYLQKHAENRENFFTRYLPFKEDGSPWTECIDLVDLVRAFKLDNNGRQLNMPVALSKEIKMNNQKNLSNAT